MEDFPEDRSINPFALGAAYLDYCVKQGWLAKKGEGQAAQYELTELGQKKLANVPFNFDLSKLTKSGEKKKHHHRT
jgi:predicted transcriptional regulator